MAFSGFEADDRGDPDGRARPRGRRARGARSTPACARSSSTSSPSTRTRPAARCALERRHALVELCRRHGVLIFEDVAYRELAYDGAALPSLWSLAPDVVVQAGTFSQDLRPGRAARLGGRAGRRDRRSSPPPSSSPTSARAGSASGWSRSTAAPGTSSARSRPRASCTRRAGGPPTARCAPTSRRAARGASRPAASSPGSRCPSTSTPIELREEATAAGVAYVPGRPFYPGDGGAQRAALLVQPPERGRDRDGRRAPRRRDRRRRLAADRRRHRLRARRAAARRPRGCWRSAPATASWPPRSRRTATTCSRSTPSRRREHVRATALPTSTSRPASFDAAVAVVVAAPRRAARGVVRGASATLVRPAARS